MEAGLVWPRVIPDLSNVQSGGPEMTRKRVAPRESTAIASGGRERYCSFGGALYGEAVITRTVEIVVRCQIIEYRANSNRKGDNHDRKQKVSR